MHYHFWVGAILVEKGRITFEDELNVFLAIEMASFQFGQIVAQISNLDKARAAFIDLYR
eukprot:UN10404